MRIVWITIILLSSILVRAEDYLARFELRNSSEGLRLVEFKTDQYDVAYRVLEAHEDTLVFKVYFTNISNRTLTVDSSLFNIVSLSSKEKSVGEDPENIETEIDKSMFFTRTELKPNESAGGRVVFSVSNSKGRWAFKNKLTSHAFNFAVKEVSE